ncbi:uncharacterized protein LOC115033089 [Acyrthosiphon pisum]|uniref:Transposable element P transposase-like RNase H domain-containing protein n=1 Tax=Acyrthosiphon pisum TaxID=7029 RepID=A0A8R2JKV0_ACYPI|nr:uncharacterized protein LOC115033089 [Acyrthosiphon pisum]
MNSSGMSGIIELDTVQTDSNAIFVESVQSNSDELIDMNSSGMSGIIELDTVQTDSNAICKYNALYFPRQKCINFYILVVESVQSNSDELIDMNSSGMSGIIELDTVQTDSNAIFVESVQSNSDELIDMNSSGMSGIIELDTVQTDSNAIFVESVQSYGDELIDMDTSLADRNLIRLLASIGVRNIRHLTPRCKKFYSITNQLIRKQRQSVVKKELFKNRLKRAEKFADSYMINKLNGKVTAAASLFTRLQLRETMKKKRGHRFTLEEKMLSLSIYKRSPKCYRLLSNLFTLPCKRTLNNLLSTVSIGPGVSPVVFQVLTENVKKLKPSERYCSLIFDEISLSSGLNYDSSANKIDGFVNSGSYKSQELADHALVFMVRGIKKKYKQPVSFTFCQGATNQHELARQIKEVIQKVSRTGLHIVATVCDQGKPNEGAIRLLNDETRAYCIKNNREYREEFYEVEQENGERTKIVHLFDVPHLIKCTRNNLVTKNLSFEMDGIKRLAKWQHLE